MIVLEIVLFVGLAIWIGAAVARADRLISDIHGRLDDIEERLENSLPETAHGELEEEFEE